MTYVRWRCAFVTLLCVSGCLVGSVEPLTAQVSTPALTPQEFYGFVLYHQALLQEIAGRRSTNPSSVEGLTNAAEQSYNITSADFAKIAGPLQILAPQLTAIDREALAYKEKAGSQPDVRILQSLYEKRNEALMQAVSSLEGSLTPQGWQNLTAYIKSKMRIQKRRF
jgi:hypothetical protein